MRLSIGERDLLNGLSLYLATRRTALRSALRLRAPLSAEAAEDLRIHYSNYFVSLMSAADLLTENASFNGSAFKQAVEAAFEALGTPDAGTNYLYVRELRNAIVHRGLNIASGAHFAGDFPLLVAPNPVINRSGAQKYSTFSFYLLGVVEGCEAVVGPTIEGHLDSLGILEKVPDVEAWTAEALELCRSSTAMPEWVKKMVPESLSTVDWNTIHGDSVAKLRDLLKPFSFTPPSEARTDGAA